MANRTTVDDILTALEQTHMHVIGSSGYGKSKFLEWLMRQLTGLKSPGFCLFDWHGTLYRDVLDHLAGENITLKPIYLLDPSSGNYITGFNPFSTTDTDMSAQVSRRIDATVKPWGAISTDETPLLSRMLRLLYSFAAASNETLPNAHLMFYPANGNVREYAAQIFKGKDDYIRQQLLDLAELKDTQLRTQVASSMNRLDRFLAPTAVRRMLGRADPKDNISIRQILDENGILLVNLAASKHLTNESGKLIAALLMNEFREAALDRAGTKKRFFLFLDEFQEYVTHDIAQMLDQVRKGGLNLVLSHQHLAQLGEDESLASSIATNARIKAVFGGLDYESATIVANEIRLKTINRRQVERQIYGHTTLNHYVETFINKSKAWSSTETTSTTKNAAQSGGYDEDDEPTIQGWSQGGGTTTTSSDTTSGGETESRLLMPVDGKELKSEQTTTHEEKLAYEAYGIMTLKPRQLYLKLPHRKEAHWFQVPDIFTRSIGPEFTAEYEAKLFKRSGALPPQEVDRLMAESREAFFAKVNPPEADPEPPAEGRAQINPRDR
jgi:hypothetical protein